MTEIFLCVFAFLAGFLDAIAGGGGLVQLPSLLVLMPTTPLPVLFGTNKLVSITGTAVSAKQYSRHVRLDLRVVVAAACAALLAAFSGAWLVAHIRPLVLKPIVLAMLAGVFVATAVRRNFGETHEPRHDGRKAAALAVLTGGAIGFYDGFIGPGTGIFLMFVFIGVFGFDFLSASASAKIVNVGTNLGALIYFASTGRVLYAVALPMIVFNMLGGVAGSRVAILRGNRFVRVLFLCLSGLLIVKLAWDTFHPAH